MTVKILCVDDEALVLSGLRRTLGQRYEIVCAQGSAAGLDAIGAEGPFAVVLSDMRMPGMDGAAFLAEVGRRKPDMVRIMLTGNSDLMTAVRAVNEGQIFRFLNKPCCPDDLFAALDAGIQQHNLICAERQILEETLNGCVKVLTEILSLTDPETFRLSDGLKGIAREVAEHMGLAQPWEVEMATMLAQLGRVTVPGEVLERVASGKVLDPDETKMMDAIPSMGGSLIKEIPRLAGVAEIVTQQNMDWGPDSGMTTGAQIVRTLQDMRGIEEGGLSSVQAIEQLAQDSKVHNPEVLSAVAICVARVASQVDGLEVSFEDLRPGNVLIGSLLTVDGRMILREGTVIGQVLMARLRNHQQVSGFQEPILIESSSVKPMNKKRKAS